MKTIIIFCIALLLSVHAIADGLMMPANVNYPKDFLKHTVSEITVNIHGIVSETVVYQEFLNEWDQQTDAVWSFPLPMDARCTRLRYWIGNIPHDAILQICQQSVNPGTGEGGIAAQVNSYMGGNVLKLKVLQIGAHSIQRIEMHYIQVMKHHRGEINYSYPLNTINFTQNALNYFKFNFNIDSRLPIISWDLPSHSGFTSTFPDSNHLQVELIKIKPYLASDLNFKYTVTNNDVFLDFFSQAGDTADGHFALFVRPMNVVDTTKAFPVRIVFLLNNSSTMIGYKLEQSILAISESLDLLLPRDEFNIVVFNTTTQKWQNQIVQANSANVTAAKNWLTNITASNGSNLDLGLTTCLNMFTNEVPNNSILVFTDAQTLVDPQTVRSQNLKHVGIFMAGIGNNINRARLEMTAELNYGQVTYIHPENNMKNDIVKLFQRINRPVLKYTVVSCSDPDVYDIVPQTIPTTYAGSFFYVAGRYQSPGNALVSVSGQSYLGPQNYTSNFTFSSIEEYSFPEKLWAKFIMDRLEWDILIYGETPEKVDSLIAISLLYKMRCRYTAYLVEESLYPGGGGGETEYTPIISNTYGKSEIKTVYPNPVVNCSSIKIFISEKDKNKTKLLKIFNLAGSLIEVIDISENESGLFEIQFCSSVFKLDAGTYYLSLQIQNNISNSTKIIISH